MSKKLHVKLYYYSKVPNWIEHIKPFKHCLELGTFDNEEDAGEEVMRIVNSLGQRGVLYSWYTDETYVENEEENTMTNAEMAKQVKEFAERLDGYRYVQDKQFVKYDADIRHLNDKLESIERRLDSTDDTAAYARQVAEDSRKIEDALKVTTRKLELISQKNVELMERNKRLSEQNVQLQEDIKNANKMCDSVSKKASKLADRVQKLEADSSRVLRLEDRVWEHEDKLAKASKLDDRMQQLEDAQTQLRLKISSVNSVYGIPEKAKTLESMYPCLWNCEHRGKECNGQAQECPIAEHFSEQLKNSITPTADVELVRHGRWEWEPGYVGTEARCSVCKRSPMGFYSLPISQIGRLPEYPFCPKCGATMDVEDTKAAGIKPIWTDDAVEKMARPILFSKFNAGRIAIVFEGNDSLEAAYLEFWREFDEWCRTSETEDKMYPQSKWPTREKRMNPLMTCPSIYKDHSSFAIWTEHDVEEGEHAFEYGALMTDWREYKTVSGLPYTVWKI